MYASSTVMAFSGMPVIDDGPTGWLNRGFPDTRRFCSPGKRSGSLLIDSHELILFRERSRERRVFENLKEWPSESDVEISSMQLPRSERCFRLQSDVNALIEESEVTSLFSRTRVVMVLDIGVAAIEIWFPAAESHVSDGN